MLQLHQGNYETMVKIPHFVQEDKAWWRDKISNQVRSLITPVPSLDIFTDANDSGWGAVCIVPFEFN